MRMESLLASAQLGLQATYKHLIKKKDHEHLHAVGTSEGAVKGWDTRGRGRKTAEGGASEDGEWYGVVDYS
jgi:hypothetical protein